MRHSSRIILMSILATLLFFGLISVSLYLYDKSFSFVDTNISRLGRPSMNPVGHWFMLIAVMSSNFVMMFYYRTLRVWMTDDAALNRAVRVLIALCYVSCVALMALSIWNSDHKMAHRLSGGVYFFSDLMMMLVGIFVIYRHPLIFKWLIPFCALSAVLDGYFLYSSGQASWAEWLTVALSFFIAGSLAINTRRLSEEHIAAALSAEEATDPRQAA